MTLRWLTADGAVAAAIVGVLVLWGAGPAGLALLAFFFVSGSALTVWNSSRGAEATTRRGGVLPSPAARTARQVLANGGWAAVGAVITRWGSDIGWAVLLGSLATAQADTWATEIGARASVPPRLITTRRPVPAGTSGGVTPLGTRAGVVGAVALAALGVLLGLPLRLAALAAAVGVLGMLVDSVLGATLEPRGRLGNDGVNLAATSFGALACAGATLLAGW